MKISGCDNPNRLGDIIFIHGLMGHPCDTWHSGKGDTEDFWPAWLGEELPELGIWSLGYEIEPLAWKENTMPLVERATNTLALLEAYDIGDRPLIFITHSMGGLLAKQMLLHAYDFGSQKWKAIVEQTKGIVYLSTPHSGADFTNWVNYIGNLLGNSINIKELQANHLRLRELNLLYRNHQNLSKIPIEVYCEKLKTYGILIVNEASADPGIPGVKTIPIDENHISISRPTSKDNLLYLRVKRFIRQQINTDSKSLLETSNNIMSAVSIPEAKEIVDVVLPKGYS
jgi:hypothetical protein